jgi:hypothetical protein
MRARAALAQQYRCSFGAIPNRSVGGAGAPGGRRWLPGVHGQFLAGQELFDIEIAR